jgi:hypothetical protein
MQQFIPVLPDTPMSVLELFEPTKKGVVSFAAQVINQVEDGKLDPLRVRLLCKTLDEVSEKINKGTKEHQEREAAKYGEKTFIYHGAQFDHAPVYTVYDYSVCGDPVYNELKKNLAELNEMLKKREDFLKSLTGQETLVSDTGEIATIIAPLKKQTMGVKVTLK